MRSFLENGLTTSILFNICCNISFLLVYWVHNRREICSASGISTAKATSAEWRPNFKPSKIGEDSSFNLKFPYLRVCHNHLKQPLKNRRNPTSPTDNTCQSLGLIFPCKKVLVVDPVPTLRFWGFWGSKNAPHLGSENIYIIPGSVQTLPQQLTG